ncbi:MAG: MarR family winged helix-turn-helix transcriptional regulator [Pararhodobacter sp.]
MTEYRLHKRLGYRASRLTKIMQNRLETALSEHGLTRLMWCVMTGVGEEGVQTPSELADYVGVTRPTISRLLKSLEARGLLQRINGSTRDGRSVRIELTARGQQITDSMRGVVDQINSHFTTKLSPEHLAAVLSGLELLADGEEQSLTDF